jgi:2-phospho-L-lactate guanylyltransferase
VTTVVIPFAGVEGKTRLHASSRLRREFSLAMLGDVLSAARAVGHVRVVTADADGAAVANEADAAVLADPGRGQGAAVQAALRGLDPHLDPGAAILIVNADVPCVAPDDLRALLAATPAGGIALVEARDGTTNALSVSAPEAFAPLYGPGSAARFHAHAESLGVTSVSVAVPNLADDVDTLEDLQRLQLRVGPRSQAYLSSLMAAASR